MVRMTDLASACITLPWHDVVFPPLTANKLAMQEWVTVIDAAIQGVPEQARNRLRTVTNHYGPSQRRSRGGTPGAIATAGGGRDQRESASPMDDRELDLNSMVSEDGTDRASAARASVNTE